MSIDQQHLHLAIRLAMNGRGLVEPNPMVGCVVVKDGRVIGEGFHRKFGEAHAEPNALAGSTESPQAATAYVTLEPCCHTEKKTPPCVPRLIEAKIARVVIGCLDPNPAVNGRGVKQLREAGIVVDGPLLETECMQLIAAFIKQTERLQPYVTLKWAQSADEKVAGPGGRRQQISNVRSSRIVQLLRSRSDIICVGINTVLSDDPELTPHGVPIQRAIRRVVLDSQLRIPLESKLVQTARQTPVSVFCLAGTAWSERAKQLNAFGVDVRELQSLGETGGSPDRRLRLDQLLLALGDSHLMVEPGPTLARGFFEQNVADRLWVIRSPIVIGDKTAPAAAAVPDHFVKTGEIDLDGDVLCEYLNTKSDVFFAAGASADFVLAQAVHPTEPGRAGP